MKLTIPLRPVGDSRGIIIPAVWLKEKEKELGQTITEVTVHLNGDITIDVTKEEK